MNENTKQQQTHNNTLVSWSSKRVEKKLDYIHCEVWEERSAEIFLPFHAILEANFKKFLSVLKTIVMHAHTQPNNWAYLDFAKQAWESESWTTQICSPTVQLSYFYDIFKVLKFSNMLAFVKVETQLDG